MYEEVSYGVTMRDSIVHVFLLLGASLLSIVALDYHDSMRLVSPVIQLLREHIVGVVVAAAVIIAVRLVTSAPGVRWH